MRKATILFLAISISCPMLISSASAVTEVSCSSEAAEQTLLRLLFQPAHDAIEAYYGAPRQYWRDKILCVQKVPDSPYYEVVLQAETFYGPHNPPYGIETMTFYVKYGSVELKKFEHGEDPEEGSPSAFYPFPDRRLHAACFFMMVSTRVSCFKCWFYLIAVPVPEQSG